MTIAIKHAFISLKGDGTDATQVQPSNWNAAHSLTLATGNILGRLSSGAGAVEEITISAYTASLLAAADAAALAGMLGLFETGDVKYTFKTTASSGWLLVTAGGSIGDATSGATLRSNADVFNLYTLIYAACNDTIAPVAGGRSGNATTDFNAHKAMTIPQLVGRSPMGAGAAAGATSARTLGQLYGEENHALTAAEIPQINSTTGGGITVNSFSDVTNVVQGNAITDFLAGGTAPIVKFNGLPNVSRISSTGTTPTINTSSFNTGNGSHNTIHPVVGLNVMVKL